MESTRILYEDNHLIVVNKKAGEIVQGDKTGDESLIDTLKAYIKEKYNKPGEVFLGLVHRIDRPVSGAVIFARTSKALTRMTVMVKNREFKKIYLAITDSRPGFETITVRHFLKKNESSNKSHVVSENIPGAKEAILECRHVGSGKTIHLVEVDLKTGRHHQIRAQLSAIGLVIHGDVKYGARRANKDGSICLHAFRVEFVHPVSQKPINICAPVPVTPEWNAFNEAINPC